MTSSRSCNRVLKNPIDDLRITRVYSSGFEKERNIVYHPDYNEEYESIDGKASTERTNICSQFVFFDGNDTDFVVSEDEDTLIERIWRLSEPPTIPRENRSIPARRIQVTKERLSSTVKGLPTLSEALRLEMAKNAKRRQKVKSDVEYVKVRSFDETMLKSCQSEGIVITPDCARTLDELL